ncbi:hypothetical protein [Pseudomonas sp. Q1-7]|uniref:hypothetical protein n=1 Tax=Pseudomonas sp. Q1-7 TaxID=3020843 RepID=UPI0023003933|nr:hypothetical protein [Pseudomonas sp. Q1-7]
MDEEMFKRCVAFAIARYAWQLKLLGVPEREEAGKEFDKRAWDIREKRETANSLEFACIYEATRPGSGAWALLQPGLLR